MVTGTLTGIASVKVSRSARIAKTASLARRKARASATACSGVMFDGRATNAASVKPQVSGPRASASISGRAAAPARCANLKTALAYPYCHRFAQKPAGDRVVTVAALPRAPATSASAPPRELPATCGRSRPSVSKNVRISSPMARIAGRPAVVSGGESPWPGRSTVMTVRCGVSRSSTGCHACLRCPTPCSSTSVGPVPCRS